MYCKKCGTQNEDNAFKCIQCGEELRSVAVPSQSTAKIPNYLTWAILANILCCPALGVVAVVYSAQVNGKIAMGDIEGAKQASKNAKMWCWLSFAISLAVYILYFAFVGFTMMSAFRGMKL